MSANYLHSFTEEKSELQKQIGCMTGILQMFDPHHLLSGRRFNGHQNKRLPSGNSIVNATNIGADNVACSPQVVLEKNLSKSLSENQRTSMESSRTSFSSTSCSSFSSVEYSKSTLQEPLSFDQATFPEKSVKNSPKLKTSEIDAKSPRIEPFSLAPNASTQHVHQSLDFQKVVKDSINRQPHNLSGKTSFKKESRQPALSYDTSPRPMQLFMPMDGTSVIGIDGKSRSPLDLKESFQVLMNLKEAPRSFSRVMEPSRSSFEAKEVPFYRVSRDGPRFSYDGREISPTFLDSHENCRLALKLRELPRLSLDSKESSMRSSTLIMKDLDRSSIMQRSLTSPSIQKELGSQKSAPSVVAKLMGLETMPILCSSPKEPVDVMKNYAIKELDVSSIQRGTRQSNNSLRSSKDAQAALSSPSIPSKDLTKPLVKNPDTVTKPFSTARAPIEPAPWKQKDKCHVPQNTYSHRDSQFKQQPETVYSEIEKRLKELEFRDSNKDLRALKQILDAMQSKGLLESKKNEEQQSQKSVRNNSNDQVSTRSDQSLGSANARKPPLPTSNKGSNTTRTHKSPIVLMKPAKSLSRFDVSTTSVIPLHHLNGLQRLQTGDAMGKKKEPSSGKADKDITPRASPRINAKSEENGQRSRLRTEFGSPRPQQSSRDSTRGLEKSSNSVSPRLQQRNNEAERWMHSVSSSDSSKQQKLLSNKQSSESVSPRTKLRHRPTKLQGSDDQLMKSRETRNLSQQGDEMSQKSDSNMSLTSQLDMEDAASMNFSSFQQGVQSPTISASLMLKQMNSPVGQNEEGSTLALAGVAPEQPSPISVLDATFYQDDLPNSVVKRSQNKFKGGDVSNIGNILESHKIGSEINQKKLESIGNLLQKLKELDSANDGPPSKDHIASLCDAQNPDHRYISEILLASGLLMKDLSSAPMGTMPIQLHPSGHPINPDMFLVLEQKKASQQLSKLESIDDSPRLHHNFDADKLHRKLVFDVVNEVLVQKLELTCSSPRPALFRAMKLKGRLPSGQQLLKQLCSEIDQLHAEAFKGEGSDDDDNEKISCEAVMQQSVGWNDYGRETPGIVLDIERSIYKDLIDEVVSSEAFVLQPKSSRRRRQLLFAK